MTRIYHNILVFMVMCALLIEATEWKPDWVENNGMSARYPSSLYISGIGMGDGKKESDRIAQARQNARAALSEVFLTQVQSTLLVSEAETATDYHSLVKSTISTQSNVHLIGVHIETWDDTKNLQAFALALLEIEPAIGNYARHLETLLEKIENTVAAAKKAEEAGDLEVAVKTYRKTFPLFVELGETRAVLNLLRGKSPFGEFGETLSRISVNHADIETRISRLLKSEIKSISSAAYALAEQLSHQLESRGIALRVFPLTYENTGFSSEFAGYFHSALGSELLKFFVVLSDESRESQGDAILTGSYWLTDEQCRIQVIITDIESGSKLAAGSIGFPRSMLSADGLEVLPRNFEKAMEEGRIFFVRDVIPGKLSLEAWTSKGNRNLLFKEDEETTLAVRVNKPCYLQIIYHLSDGKRLLLENNLYIDVSKVNHVYTLPDTFYVAPPFGVERLQIFAKTEKFEPVRVTQAVFDDEV